MGRANRSDWALIGLKVNERPSPLNRDSLNAKQRRDSIGCIFSPPIGCISLSLFSLTPSLGSQVNLSPKNVLQPAISNPNSQVQLIFRVLLGFNFFSLVEFKPQTRMKMREPKLHLCDDIVEEIVSRLPYKSRERFKSVSKKWLEFISRLPPPPTAFGLAVFTRISKELAILKAEGEGEGGSFTLRSSLVPPHGLSWLIDSCDGLLLLGKRERSQYGDFVSYHVFSPITEKCIALPLAHSWSRIAVASLSFNSSTQKFKVICLFWDEVDVKKGTIKFQSLSSEDREWRESAATIENHSLLCIDGFNRDECHRPSLYYEGRMLWIWSLCLLVYDDEEEEGGSFCLLELPNRKISSSNYHDKFLWHSEDRVHYCASAKGGFCIWVALDSNLSAKKGWTWELKRRIALDESVGVLKDEVSDGNDNMLWLPSACQPCAFNEDFQILYFKMRRSIAGYSLRKHNLLNVWPKDVPFSQSHLDATICSISLTPVDMC